MFSISDLKDVIPVLRPTFTHFLRLIIVIYFLTGALLVAQRGTDYCGKVRERAHWGFTKFKAMITTMGVMAVHLFQRICHSWQTARHEPASEV